MRPSGDRSLHLDLAEVKILLATDVATVPELQSMKDDRGQDGESAEDKKGLPESVDHLGRV